MRLPLYFVHIETMCFFLQDITFISLTSRNEVKYTDEKKNLINWTVNTSVEDIRNYN